MDVCTGLVKLLQMAASAHQVNNYVYLHVYFDKDLYSLL